MVFNIIFAIFLFLVLIGIGVLIYLIGVKIFRPYKKLASDGSSCIINNDCTSGSCIDFKCTN